jgi:cytochrome c-type biogenesis protein CcmH
VTRHALRIVGLALVLCALVIPSALASEAEPTQGELEEQLVCPTCHTTLDESDSPVARQMKAYIRRRIAQGATRSQIIDEFVGPPNNLGQSVLGVPAKRGFDLLAWVIPLGGIAIGAAAIGAGAWYWSRSRPDRSPGAVPAVADGSRLDPELERRVDEELARFDA